MAKILMTAIQVNLVPILVEHGEGNTNLPELSLSYHRNFLVSTLDFTSFSQQPKVGAPHLTLFEIQFCNCTYTLSMHQRKHLDYTIFTMMVPQWTISGQK